MDIGRLKRVDLRELWRHEARDFTAWLSENLDLLGETLGLQLSLLEREAAAGPFSADILAIEAAFGGPLDWQRQDDRRGSRIRHVITVSGLKDRERWPQLQDTMIDAMVRLERAFRPEIKLLSFG